MDQAEKARAFAALHVKGDPVVLYNIWDAGTAAAVAKAGAKALATGSWSVAEAQGYRDGEQLPLDLLEAIVGRICATTDLPVSLDFEGAYAASPEGAAANAARMLGTGIVGINFEDQVVGGAGLHPVEAQAARIAAIRAAADGADVPLVINARTDLFLKAPDPSAHAGLMTEAIARAEAYAAAGGTSFFAPALSDPALIERLCAAAPIPVNVMMRPGAPDLATLARLGVARVSYGPGPYRQAMAELEAAARAIYGA